MFSLSGHAPSVPATQIPHAVGYSLLAHGALDVAELPGWRYGRTGRPAEGSFSATETPALATADSTVWQGDANVLFILRALHPDKADRLQALENAIDQLVSANTLSYVPGRFVRTRDGRVRFDET